MERFLFRIHWNILVISPNDSRRIYIPVHAETLEEAEIKLKNENDLSDATYSLYEMSSFFHRYCKENMTPRRLKIRQRHAKRFEEKYQAWLNDPCNVDLSPYDKWTFLEMLEMRGYSYIQEEDTIKVFPSCNP